MDSSPSAMRRLYKSRQNRMIDGVCGGLAAYFEIDPTIVRILMVLLCLMGGAGFLLYIVAMVIMPVNPEHIAVPQPVMPPAPPPTERKRMWGVILILIGAFILMINLGFLADFGWWSFSSEFIFPMILIFLGIFFIYVQTRKSYVPPGVNSTGAPEFASTEEPQAPRAEGVRELRRAISNKKICGVCAGIAKYFDIDPTIVRIIAVVLTLATSGWGLLPYILLCILMPEEKPITTSM